MAKDPAFLFYYQDFLVGIDDMSNEEAGAYIRCLCHQAAKSTISEKHMMKICLRQDVFDVVRGKFISVPDGGLINERLQLEINKRIAFAESRRNNRLKKSSDKHMSNISSSYDKHMENENENENEIVIKDEIENKKRESKKFNPPSEDDVHNYMAQYVMQKRLHWSDQKISSEASNFVDFYESKGWMVGKIMMRSWEASARKWLNNNDQYTIQNKNGNTKATQREQQLDQFRQQVYTPDDQLRDIQQHLTLTRNT